MVLIRTEKCRDQSTILFQTNDSHFLVLLQLFFEAERKVRLNIPVEIMMQGIIRDVPYTLLLLILQFLFKHCSKHPPSPPSF